MRNIIAVIILCIMSTFAFAATYTTYYNLYKPASGEKNWATQVNANFDTIDSTLYSKVDTSTMTASLALKLNTSSVGAANGAASLGSDGKVPDAQLPASLAGALVYQGVLDASGAAYPGSPAQGDYYIISVAGTISGTAYLIGDWAVYNGTSWDKIDNSASSSGWTDAGTTVQLVTSSDNVGIGTTVAPTKLTVSGTVTATTFAGNATTATLASSATALAANGANCSAGSYPLGVDDSGAVESCTDATTEIDSVVATHNAVTSAHSATSSNTASRIVLRDGSGAFSAGIITASLFGNASTATALASNPTDCSAGQYASSIDAAGNLTCATPSTTISGLTTNYVTKAASSTTIANSQIFDNGTNVGIGSASPTQKLDVVGTIKATAFSGNATTATALAANGTNCTSGTYPLGVDSAGNAENCEAVNAVDLSNLDQGIYFDTNGVYNIGTSTNRIKNIHVDGGVYGYGSGTSYFASNVGIGSTIPRAALDVEGTVYIDGWIYQNGALFTGGSSQWTGTNPISYANNVGINSTSPQAQLVIGTSTKSSVDGINDLLVGDDVEIDSNLYVDGSVYLGSFTESQKRNNTPLQVKAVAVSTNPISVINAAGFDIFHIQADSAGASTFSGKTETSTTYLFMSATANSYWNGTGNYGIGSTSPAAKLQVDGSVYADLFIPSKYTTLTTTANLTQANMLTAAFIDADMTSGSYTMTMFSDLGNAAIPPALVGSCWDINIKTASGTNALTIALDADLTLTTLTAITAGGAIIEDKGDWANCCVTGVDDMRCTTYEAD